MWMFLLAPSKDVSHLTIYLCCSVVVVDNLQIDSPVQGQTGPFYINTGDPTLTKDLLCLFPVYILLIHLIFIAEGSHYIR